jgi:hypothetical protein
MSLNQHHRESHDDQSDIPADARNSRPNALADRARSTGANAMGRIQGWGPRLF